MRNFLLPCLMNLLIAVAVCDADDWPQWLGPERDSVWRETGIIDQFPDDGARVVWRREIAGGYAGPAVASGRVYVTDFVTSADTTGDPGKRPDIEGTERVLCLSSDDGKLVWKREYACHYKISYPAGPRTTPTVDEGMVYTLGAEGNLYCLKADDGSVVWSRELKKDYNTEAPYWGFSSHPLVVGHQLICIVGGPSSVAVSLDKRTGKELWRALSADQPGYAPPTLVETGGKQQLIIWHPEAVNGLDPETGEVYWSKPLEPNFGMSIASPRLLDDYLFVGGVINKSMLLKLSDAGRSAEVVWYGTKGKGLGPGNSTPFLEDGHLYGVDKDGELRCVELATGRQIWSTYAPTTNDRRANYATAFLVKNGDRFFLPNEKGELVIARLSPQGYEEVSRAQVLESTGSAFGRPVVWSHPAFANRCMFARNDKEIVCVSLAAE